MNAALALLTTAQNPLLKMQCDNSQDVAPGSNGVMQRYRTAVEALRDTTLALNMTEDAGSDANAKLETVQNVTETRHLELLTKIEEIFQILHRLDSKPIPKRKGRPPNNDG